MWSVGCGMSGLRIGSGLEALGLRIDGDAAPVHPDEGRDGHLSGAAPGRSVWPDRADGHIPSPDPIGSEPLHRSLSGRTDGELPSGALGRLAIRVADLSHEAESPLRPADLAAPAGGGLTPAATAGEPEAPLLSTYTSGKCGLGVVSAFNVTVTFEGTWSADLQQRFVLAAEYLSALILGDMPDRNGIDDIAITATLSDIDGQGGVLGQAGPTSMRTGSALPFEGMMEFDLSDAADFDAQGLFDDIVIHEMLHTLGFGTLWDQLGLTAGAIFTDDLVFTGPNAASAFAALFPDIWEDQPSSRKGMPIETDGGQGTAGGHWDEDTFGDELMTGYLGDGNSVSAMTVAALEDMGYDTVFDPSDPSAPVLQPDDLGRHPSGAGKDDRFVGGAGDDTYVVDSTGDVVVEPTGGGTDTVQASISYVLGANVENLNLLGSGDLDGTGNALGNGLTGNGGANRLRGKGGDDALYGLGGQDDLEGAAGDDELEGGTKADVLEGGRGRDLLWGQGGNDDFVFASLKDSGTTKSTRDQILDFKGKDDIVLSGLDADTGQGGDQAFRIDDGGSFEAGEIRITTVNAGLKIELNVDGDSKAELSILLKDFTGTINATDFDF